MAMLRLHRFKSPMIRPEIVVHIVKGLFHGLPLSNFFTNTNFLVGGSNIFFHIIFGVPKGLDELCSHLNETVSITREKTPITTLKLRLCIFCDFISVTCLVFKGCLAGSESCMKLLSFLKIKLNRVGICMHGLISLFSLSSVNENRAHDIFDSIPAIDRVDISG